MAQTLNEQNPELSDMLRPGASVTITPAGASAVSVTLKQAGGAAVPRSLSRQTTFGPYLVDTHITARHISGSASWVKSEAEAGVERVGFADEVLCVVEADAPHALTSFADVPGLSVPVRAGARYCFEARVFHKNDANTTGSQFAVNLGTAPTALRLGLLDTVSNSATASGHAAGTATARDTAAAAETAGSTDERMAVMSGYAVPAADDTLTIRMKSEVAVAAGVTVLAGSWLRVWRVA